MSMPRLTAIGWIATGCSLTAVAAVIVSVTSNALDGWAPNVATEALSIALTVGLVSWIVVRRGDRERSVEVMVALDGINHAYLSLALTLLFDKSHPTPDDVAGTALETVAERWKAGLSAENAKAAEGSGTLVAFRRLVAAVDEATTRHGRVLDPDYRAAMAIFLKSSSAAENRYLTVDDGEHRREQVLRMYADATSEFVAVHGAYTMRWSDLPFETIPADFFRRAETE